MNTPPKRLFRAGAAALCLAAANHASAGLLGYWTFDGNYEKPTFAPSILCYTEYDDDAEGDLPVKLPNGQRKTLCHYFIREGMIEFCGDSPHAFAGQTVELPEWPYVAGAYGGVEDD